eukprot:1793109-Rhodomonas_salina.2
MAELCVARSSFCLLLAMELNSRVGLGRTGLVAGCWSEEATWYKCTVCYPGVSDRHCPFLPAGLGQATCTKNSITISTRVLRNSLAPAGPMAATGVSRSLTRVLRS